LVALYVTSLGESSGKTTVCTGLGKHLSEAGKKVGFFKPVIAGSKSTSVENADPDVEFIKHVLALKEPVDIIAPTFSDEGNMKSRVKEAYDKVAQGKDVVIVEGISIQNQAARDTVDKLNARVIAVESYSKELLKAIDSYKGLGECLLGIVLNRVPGNRLEQVSSEASVQAEQAGVKIIGVLPEDRTLFAPTIGELVEFIEGETLRGAEKADELAENIMLGARNVDSGPEYFGIKDNKAVVLRTSRPDMQLAALETSTRCLVLSGEGIPYPAVSAQAEKKDIPIIQVKDDVSTTATKIEEALGRAKFNQENKLPKLTEIMEQHFDFATVYKGLGLAS